MLYDDPSVTYDDASLLYEGIQLGDYVTLIVSGSDVTSVLADRGLSVTVNNHGNSLGTLDATLIDPSTVPAMDNAVRLYIGSASRYEGTIKSLDMDEYRGGHLFVAFGAQDSGPEAGAIPSAAPFNLSDAPDGVSTYGYERLSKKVQNTDGGTVKTTYTAVVGRDGLWIDQNVDVTAANYGLSGSELTIKKATARWRTPDSPEYALELGDPTVSLAQVIADGDFIPSGSITATKISDGAITTPKLNASATIALVTNSGSDVVINPSGLTVTDGAITVSNASATVIIDGTSNMFKILATGTQSVVVAADGSDSATVTLSGLGALSTTPAHISFLANGNTDSANQHLGSFFTQVNAKWTSSTNGGTTNQDVVIPDQIAEAHTNLDGSDQVRAIVAGWNRTGSSVTYYHRYYVLKEAAL